MDNERVSKGGGLVVDFQAGFLKKARSKFRSVFSARTLRE
jgi:hypothetical protein